MERIRNLVDKIVHKHGTNDPYVLCKKLGILLRQVNLINVRGIYQNHFRKKIIYINNTLNPSTKSWVLAHELGHAVLHKNINTVFLYANADTSIDKFELEANKFASELLFHTRNLESK